MSERIGTLKAILDIEHSEIRALLESLTRADLSTKTDLGWTIGQVAGHIADSPSADVYVAKRLAQGKNATLPAFLGFIINLGNWWGARKYKHTSCEALLQAWDSQHAKLTSYVGGLTDAELEQAGVVMGMGKVTLYHYLEQSPSHAREHANTIEKALARA